MHMPDAHLIRRAGTRACLRPLAAPDATALSAVLGDIDVMRHWTHAPLRRRVDREWYLRDAEAGARTGSHYRWAITTLADDALVGLAGLHGFSRDRRCAEISYALAKAFWKRGLAEDASRLLIGIAFEVFDLERIEARVEPENLASRRLLARLDFRAEPVVHAEADESTAGTMRYALLR